MADPKCKVIVSSGRPPILCEWPKCGCDVHSQVTRWQNPVTGAFHFEGYVTLEDMQAVMARSGSDSSVLDFAFDKSADPSRWLRGFAHLFQRMVRRAP